MTAETLSPSMEEPKSDVLLSIHELTVDYWGQGNEFQRAVDGVNLDVKRGEVLGLAGESGSGKSTIASAIMRLIEPPSKAGGEIRMGRSNILRIDSAQVRAYRWKLVAMVFQGAMNSLDPVFTISNQIVETIRAHDPKISKSGALAITRRLLEQVGIDCARANDYPHQLSGGMRQRVMLAMALALNPKLLIADEPTSALDVVTQKQIMELLRLLKKQYNLSVLFITHDLPLLSEIADRIAIMHRGRIVELGAKKEVLHSPLHPYTQLLVESVPDLNEKKDIERYESIGALEVEDFQGCRFYSRCPIRIDECRSVDPLLRTTKSGTGSVACIRRDGWRE
jgi:peptide/nickel transport system ATP-binding protein